MYGWVVTYEDPRYAYEGDVVDVTGSIARGVTKPVQRILVPRGGPFSFAYVAPSPDSSPGDIQKVLEAMLVAYDASGYPGTFRVSHAGDVFHVTPTSIRALDGRVVEQKSILDVRISIPSEEGRSTYNAVAAVTAAVERTTGHKILIGTVPLDLMSDTRMEQGSTNEFARDILLRTLAATGTGLSWQLLYDPGLKS